MYICTYNTLENPNQSLWSVAATEKYTTIATKQRTKNKWMHNWKWFCMLHIPQLQRNNMYKRTNNDNIRWIRSTNQEYTISDPIHDDSMCYFEYIDDDVGDDDVDDSSICMYTTVMPIEQHTSDPLLYPYHWFTWKWSEARFLCFFFNGDTHTHTHNTERKQTYNDKLKATQTSNQRIQCLVWLYFVCIVNIYIKFCVAGFSCLCMCGHRHTHTHAAHSRSLTERHAQM